ncbi:MAG: zinc/iron-chelating domain-containing protein [Desulfuromonadales bacterium]|nr:MAG: zinc/iron-chelating domain-containing protein [Desulfuromonadales bacterium]
MWQTLTEELRREHAGFDSFSDEWIESYSTAGGTIHCGRGCGTCCSLAVNATFTEALIITEAITDIQAAAVREHVAKIRALIPMMTDLKSWLRLHRRKLGACPLLAGDGTCGVYGVRPFSCRALLATKESRWCGADFAELTTEEKRSFVESLDRTVVGFPMHYVAATQERGLELEARTARAMDERFGFSLYGNLPVLIFLEREHELSRVITQGYAATMRTLERAGLFNPFLVSVEG